MDSSLLHVGRLFAVARKVVVVTGGSRGIGKMIACAFVRNGATVYISARSANECHATANELRASGPGSCTAIPADMSKFSEVERFVKELSAHESAVHVLINNAGTTWVEPIDEYPDQGFAKVLSLNLHRVFTLIQKLLPLLRAGAAQGGMTGVVYNDPARIINIGSVEAIGVPNRDTYAYAAAKAGLHHLSRHLAGRLGPEGIVSNTIACGPFQSKMMAHLLELEGDVILNQVPTNRLGTPEDVAGATLFLASRAGAYVNGATVALDGGLLVNMPMNKL